MTNPLLKYRSDKKLRIKNIDNYDVEMSAHIFFDKRAEMNSINFALFSSEDLAGSGTEGVCHADMNIIAVWCNFPDKATLFATGLRCYENGTEDAHFFWNDILGPESPWRNLGPFEVLFNGNKPVAVLVKVDDTTDNRFLVNFAIATRQPYERQSSVTLYRKLREDGISLETALLVSLCISVSGYNHFLQVTGHNPFDFKTSLSLLRKGAPNLSNTNEHLLRKRGYYTPNNAIWYGDSCLSSPEQFYMNCSGKLKTAEANVFKVAYRKHFNDVSKKGCSYDQVKEACKYYDNHQ